eukprot:gene10460-46769_t
MPSPAPDAGVGVGVGVGVGPFVVTNLFKQLAEEEFDLLRESWRDRGRGDRLRITDSHLRWLITEAQFIALVAPLCTRIFPDTPIGEVGEALSELFGIIDAEGTGLMGWEPFLSHMIEQTLRGRPNEVDRPGNVLPYRTDREGVLPQVNMSGTGEDQCRKMVYFPSVHKLLVCSRTHRAKILDPSAEFSVVKTLPHDTAIIDACYVQRPHACVGQQHVVLTSSADLKVRTFRGPREDYVPGPVQVQRETQMVLRWCDADQVLYSGARNGDVNAWDLTMHERLKPLSRSAGRSSQPVMDICCRPRKLFSVSLDKSLLQWDVTKMGDPSYRPLDFKGQHKKGIYSSATDDDGGTGQITDFVHLERSRELVFNTPRQTFLYAELRNQAGLARHLAGQCNQSQAAQFMRHEVSRARHHVADKEEELRQLRRLVDGQINPSCAHEVHSPVFLTVGGTEVKIWDAVTGVVLIHLKNLFPAAGGPTMVTAGVVEASGRKFLLGAADGRVAQYRFADCSTVREFRPPGRGAGWAELTALAYIDDDATPGGVQQEVCVLKTVELPYLCKVLRQSNQLGLLLAGDEGGSVHCVSFSGRAASITTMQVVHKCEPPDDEVADWVFFHGSNHNTDVHDDGTFEATDHGAIGAANGNDGGGGGSRAAALLPGDTAPGCPVEHREVELVACPTARDAGTQPRTAPVSVTGDEAEAELRRRVGDLPPQFRIADCGLEQQRE